VRDLHFSTLLLLGFAIRMIKNLQQRLNYIHNNLVKEEFVYLPEEYKSSSAIDYSGAKGMLNVEVIK